MVLRSDRTFRTQKSHKGYAAEGIVDAEGRVRFFKLAWDAVGSEFGSRHQQYEMFYAGANMVTRGHAFRTCDWEQATGMVDQFMSTYDLQGIKA